MTGRWLSNDPIGISGGLNQYVAFNNNPVNVRDPLGLWNLFNPSSYFMGNDASMNWYDSFNPLHNSANWGGQFMALSQGAASTLDGIIPFFDPFESAYTDECGKREWYYDASRSLAAFSRNAYLGARIPNIAEWSKHPLLYEAGATTVSQTTLAAMKGMSAAQKGLYLAGQSGGLLRAGLGTTWSQIGNTILTGGTPGANLLLLGGAAGGDAYTLTK